MVANQVTREPPSIFAFVRSILYVTCFEASFWWRSFRGVSLKPF